MWRDEHGITLWSTMVVCSAMAMILTGLMSTLWRSVHVLQSGSASAQAAWLCRSDAAIDLRTLESNAALPSWRTTSPNGTLVREVSRSGPTTTVRITATVNGVLHVLQFQYDDTTHKVSSWEDAAAVI